AFSIDNKFLEQQISMFYCPLCVKPMRDPVQMSTCGHRFCDTCLQEYLSEGVFKCPEDHLPLDYAKTFSPDPTWKNFQRPRPGALGSVRGGCLDESMLGFGYPKFLSHEEMRKRNYIRDNAIFIKASIDVVQKILNS
uniref:TNF receptor-associated factor 4-like n=1 Tax=Sinocyclocheilus rhinocerous TaxID=307959 RepID=A0A673M9X8_9TELE